MNKENLDFWASLDLDSLSSETEWQNLSEIIEDENIDLDFIDEETKIEYDPYADDYDFYDDYGDFEDIDDLDDYLDSLIDAATDGEEFDSVTEITSE